MFVAAVRCVPGSRGRGVADITIFWENVIRDSIVSRYYIVKLPGREGILREDVKRVSVHYFVCYDTSNGHRV